MWQITKECPRCLCRLLVAFFAVVLVSSAVTCSEITDFIAVNTLTDGEVETRIYYGGVSAKETTVGKGVSNGIKFRQLSDGKHFIQLIYDDSDTIIDCEFIQQKDQVKTFLFNFKNELRDLIATSNITVLSLDDRPVPDNVKVWFNYTELKNVCKRRHEEIRKTVQDVVKSQQNGTRQNERHKRDFSDMFRVPGTKWCGKGYSADKYTRLGGFSRTDKCCRRHDMSCPFWIGGFETKYGLFNWRVNTLMHCNCDERFRACLKLVGSSEANLVGKLFFNVVQTQCFVLKPKKKCVKRSWWGKCERRKVVKQAFIRDNLPY